MTTLNRIGLRTSSAWQSPAVRQDDVAVVTSGTHRPLADHSGLDVEQRGGLQAVLDLSLCFEDHVDAVLPRKQGKGCDLTFEPRSQLVVVNVAWRGNLAVKRRDRLSEAVDDRQAASHHRKHLRD